MLKSGINHVWFDFSNTIAFLKKERHDRLCYETYSRVVGRPVNDELIAEYKSLHQQYSHSNAAIFRSLGQSSNFWSNQVNSVESSELYELAEKDIPVILEKIKDIVSISIFSNIQLGKILSSLSISPDWFTHVINAGMVKEPKPALDGFYKMIELSDVPAQEILYIGDDVRKDVRPAKKVGVQTGLMWRQSDVADYSFKNFGEILKLLSE